MRLEEEIGQKIMDSPLRRAREYACSIAGSPSPHRQMVRKGSYEFAISPTRAKCAKNDSPSKEMRCVTEAQKTPFGIMLQKRGVSKTMKKAATGSAANNTAWQTPDKKAANHNSRSLSKGAIGSRMTGAQKRHAF